MKSKDIPSVALYSDGGADPNPGKGGYGVILSYQGHRKELSQGYQHTTNNRMELTAVIAGLEQLKIKSKVSVFSDSKYVVDGIEKGWAQRWQANHWYRTKKEKAVNHDLWKRLLELLDQHDVTFRWVKGHNGHPENERCDELATLAMGQATLKDDPGFTQEELPSTSRQESFLSTKISGKSKITQAGDPCRKCYTPVVKKVPSRRKIKANQTYYYEYYLLCPTCNTMYTAEEARREIDKPSLF